MTLKNTGCSRAHATVLPMWEVQKEPSQEADMVAGGPGGEGRARRDAAGSGTLCEDEKA